MDLLNPLNPLSPLNPISPLNPNGILNSSGPSEPVAACIPDAMNNFCQLTAFETGLIVFFIVALVILFGWIFKIMVYDL